MVTDVDKSYDDGVRAALYRCLNTRSRNVAHGKRLPKSSDAMLSLIAVCVRTTDTLLIEDAVAAAVAAEEASERVATGLAERVAAQSELLTAAAARVRDCSHAESLS